MTDVSKGKPGGIKSFFCTDFFSAAILNKGSVAELVACGDVVNETTSPIPVESVTIGECLQRRCCFYTGKNKDGNEFCMYADATIKAELDEAQKDAKFAVGECVEDWKATLYFVGGKTTSVDCGVTLDLTGQTYDRIVLSRCPTLSSAVFEAVDDPEGFVDGFQADQAIGDNFQADQAFVDNFQADQAIGDSFQADQAFVDGFQADQAIGDNFQTDQAFVDDFQADQAFGDNFQADQAFVDSFQADQAFQDADLGDFDAQAVADSFEQAFEGQVFVDSNEADQVDFATNAQGTEYSAGSTILGSVVAFVAVVALLF